METMSWKDQQQSQFVIIADLWQEYIGSRDSQPDDYLQRLHMLQESIRRTMRAEHASYLAGVATSGRVSETKGHAILIGKIIANWSDWLEKDGKLTVAQQLKSRA